MSEDTINGTVNSNSSSDSMALTDAQLVEYAAMNPFIIYLDGGEHVKNKSVVAALLEGVRPATTDTPNSIKVRKQGVRKGELGYNAKATITDRKLVPVFALVEERLVDEMRVSPAALAMGMEALRPDLRNLVDCLVEEYVEAAPIEREFFNAEPDIKVAPQSEPSVEDVLTTGYDINSVSPTFTGTLTMVDANSNVDAQFDPQLQDQLLTAYTQNNCVGQTTLPETIAADVTTPEWDGYPIDISTTSGTRDVPHGTNNMFDGNYVDSIVPQPEAGVVADGELLNFNPEVHVIP